MDMTEASAKAINEERVVLRPSKTIYDDKIGAANTIEGLLAEPRLT